MSLPMKRVHTGKHHPCAGFFRTRLGFTAIEVFAVISLLIVLLALGISRYDRILEAWQRKHPKDVASAMVRQGHILARQNQEMVYLGYDAENGSFLIWNGSGRTLKSEVLPRQGDEAPSVRFYRILPEERLSGEMSFTLEELPVESIPFHPAGGTPPFVMILESGLEQSVLRFDPFSSAMVEVDEVI